MTLAGAADARAQEPRSPQGADRQHLPSTPRSRRRGTESGVLRGMRGAITGVDDFCSVLYTQKYGGSGRALGVRCRTRKRLSPAGAQGAEYLEGPSY